MLLCNATVFDCEIIQMMLMYIHAVTLNRPATSPKLPRMHVSWLVQFTFPSLTVHWLPSEYRINFKIAKVHFLHSAFMSDVQPMNTHSTRFLTLWNTNLLSVSFVRTSLGARRFSVAAATICNSLSSSLKVYRRWHFPQSPQDPLF